MLRDFVKNALLSDTMGDILMVLLFGTLALAILSGFAKFIDEVFIKQDNDTDL
ncbi:hypothetical protein CLV58_12516 [Spirosoma oryzae]|uniref:Uncharacterized protein n=1 Tax=Spirosoma oryzae TaxID=1469603 RepID=A0A2T0S8J4_9BACT|nr:hypothetical protein CLV58_12516 [Spirosoma oryzae]